MGVESTIVDLTEDRPRLLRPGGITPEQLISVLGDLVIDKAVTAQIDKDAVVKAPGMKYRHYAPAEPVVIVSGSREKAAAYIRRHFTPGDRVLCFEEELPLYAGSAPCPTAGRRTSTPCPPACLPPCGNWTTPASIRSMPGARWGAVWPTPCRTG